MRLLMLASLALSVAILTELTYRVYLFGIAGLSIAQINSVHQLGRSGLVRASESPEIIYELKPNQTALFKLARFRTNSQGLADREYSISKPDDTLRIILLGASYSMPAGVPLEDSWQQLLEGELNAHAKGKHYEVVNFAVGGYDLRQMIATLKYRATAYHPDLVLVELTRNSPRMLRPEEDYHRRYVPHEATRPFFHSFALDVLLRREDGDRGLTRHESRARFDRELANLAHFTEDLRLPTCFVLLRHEPEGQEETKRLREQVARTNSCIIDTSPDFENERFSDLILYRIDPHPNAKAHRIFARAVFEALVSQKLLPEIQ
jgi:hypothetical protein